ncbi:MAG: metal-dependent hydrolase [Candidatus Pacearchaeota archaeon]|jgi:inner membrane protein
MLIKTHLTITIFAIILFLPLVNNPISFVAVTLVATVLPDFDNRFSKYGKNIAAKATQLVTHHRGFAHSLTICFLISLILAIFIPILAFGFFLGYSLHLMADSFNKIGITPFWPYSKKAFGFVEMNTVVEKGIFFGFFVVDFILILVRVAGII